MFASGITVFFVGFLVAAPSSATQPRNPYKNLFARPALPQTPGAPERLVEQRDDQKKKVVCGLTIIAADPRIDPAFSMPVPEKNTTFTITAVPPPVCRQ